MKINVPLHKLIIKNKSLRAVFFLLNKAYTSTQSISCTYALLLLLVHLVTFQKMNDRVTEKFTDRLDEKLV